MYLLHADGAGSKAILAYLYWKETGDVSVFRGIAQDAIVMNLDDMLCAGCYDGFLFNSIINRNARRIPGEVLASLISGTKDFIDSLEALGIRAKFSGGETADMNDAVQTLTVDSTGVARFRRQDAISAAHIQVGDVVVGLASDGQSIYENEPNSGIGSNGLTLARHVLLSEYYATQYPESYDSAQPKGYAYKGPHRLADKPKGFPMPLGRYLLSPTRTYAPLIRDLLMEHRARIHALIHCTGGGQTKILGFLKAGLQVVKKDWFPIPLLFARIQSCGNVSWEEMYEVFNMGHRMEVYTDRKTAEWLIAHARKTYHIEAKVVGYVHDAQAHTRQLRLQTPHGTFFYERPPL